MQLKRWVLPLVLAVAVGLGGMLFLAGSEQSEDRASDGEALATVVLPESFSTTAQIGQKVFDANCAACHGVNAAGRDGLGPPLVHLVYEPSHHADESIYRAVAMGVMAHHWRFGNMPRVEGVSRREVDSVVAYIRELQRTNGIK